MGCGDCGRVLLSSTRRNRNCCEEHAGDSDPHDQYLLESEYTAASVLERILTVDGAGSGLDSDLLDGLNSTAFSLDGHTHVGIGAHTHAGEDIISGLVADLRIASTIARDSEVFGTVLANDGSGSGLDADLLDGLNSTAFALASHTHAGEDITSGTIADARIASTITRDSEVFTIVLSADGTGSGLDADLLDGLNSSAFALASHVHAGEDITSGTVADARIASTITRDSEVFGIVLANDGSGSGLDADLLDGLSSAAFALVSHTHAGEDITSGTIADARIASTITRDSEVFGIVLAADGAGSGLDADLLDGVEGAGYALVSHVHAGEDITSGTVADARIDSTLTNKTLVTPTIASFVNAAHTHQDAAGGAQLDHGLALSAASLLDDDHTGYLLATGARTGASSVAQPFTNGVVTGHIRPAADSTTAIRFFKADGTTVIATFDSTNARFGIGITPTVGFEVLATAASIMTRSITSGAPAPDSAVQIGLGGAYTAVAGGGPSFLFFGNNTTPAKGFIGRLSAVWENGTAGAEAGAIILSVRANTADTTASTERLRIGSGGLITLSASDATTNAIVNTLLVKRISTGTAAAGFGSALAFQLESSTTNDQDAGRLTYEWVTATHASRASAGKLTAFSVANERTALYWLANSTDVTVGLGQSATLTAAFNLVAPSTTRASVRLLTGTAPTTPNDGDLWHDGALTFMAEDATTAAIVDTLRMRRGSSGTPAAGFGGAFNGRLKSSTTANQEAVRLIWKWNVATHASREAYGDLTAFYTTTERTCISWGANSTVPLLGVLGATPVARPASYTLAATATRTMPTPEATFTGQDNTQVGSVYAKSDDLITLQTRLDATEGVLRQLIIDLASTSGFGLLAAS